MSWIATALGKVEEGLIAAGVTPAMFRTVASTVVMDLIGGKSPEDVLKDVLDLFRNKQI